MSFFETLPSKYLWFSLNIIASHATPWPLKKGCWYFGYIASVCFIKIDMKLITDVSRENYTSRMFVVSRTYGISSAPLSVHLTISAKRLAQLSWFFAWILIILWDIFHQTSKNLVSCVICRYYETFLAKHRQIFFVD